MNDALRKEVIRHGDKVHIIPVERLSDLKQEIKIFAESEELNGFQQWIINKLYNFTIPKTDFTVRSIILMALHHPFYADVLFNRDGREYWTKCVVQPDFQGAELYLKAFLDQHGFHAEQVENLPMKRLSVQSGFAEYGRNNIAYIQGLGSNFMLMAFFSDMPCEKDTWRSAVTAKPCEKCSICMNTCPTGAIRKNKFLIDNRKCLSAINEGPGEFPEWLPETVHHTCYDCLRCQEQCPMNAGYIDKMKECIVFSEQDTNKLLDGDPIESFCEETKAKIYLLGLDQCYAAIPRNIKVLMR